METNLRIALDELDFRQLVAGKVVTITAIGRNFERQQVEISISDIGWKRMLEALIDAEVERVEALNARKADQAP